MEPRTISRRKFLLTVGATGAAAAVGAKLFQLGDTEARELERETPKLISTVCGMCEANCGLIAYVKGEHLYKLEGNYKHSHSDGRICPRGSAAVKLLYDPDRLRFPLKRVGNDRFERISWEQAFEEIGQKLQQLRADYGPQSLAWARHPEMADEWDQQFMKAFGSPNIFSHLSVAQSSRLLACRHTVGGEPAMDLRNSRYILLFGRNHGEAIFTADIQSLMAAKEKGARIVAVDPRLSNTAAQAHEWIPIRPGTDGALLLAMMNVIVQENLYDAKFVADHTTGFEELRAFLADKTPAWAAKKTDVAPDTIRRIARELAEARPACGIDPGHHGAWGDAYANSLQTARAALILNALLGNYGAKGGLAIPQEPVLGKFSFPTTPTIKVSRVDGAGEGEFSLVDRSSGIVQRLPEIILSEKPYPIRALVVNRFNPARALPNSEKTAQALSGLDLLVVIDTMPSETAELAHYILPESTFLERLDPLAVSRRFQSEVAIRQPVVQTLHDTKPGTEIIAGLAKATGLGDYFKFTVESVLAARIFPFGTTVDEFKQKGVLRSTTGETNGTPKFSTPSGKIEIYSDTLKDASIEPLPVFQPTLVEPGVHSFRLLQGRVSMHTNSSTQNNGWLNRLQSENELWINTVRAARLRIGNGDKVRVRSETGEVVVRAKVTEAIHPTAVFLAHGFGGKARKQHLSFGKGVNDNDLVVGRVTPGTGGGALSETIVTLERVA